MVDEDACVCGETGHGRTDMAVNLNDLRMREEECGDGMMSERAGHGCREGRRGVTLLTDEGTRRGELMRFSAASTTPSAVWIPTAVLPSCA